MVLLFPQQLQDEVPQLDLSGARARLGLVGPVWEGEPWAERGAGKREKGEVRACRLSLAEGGGWVGRGCCCLND